MKPGEAGCRRSRPKLQVRLLQPGHRSPSRLPRRTPQPWQPIPPAHSHGAVTSHHWHGAPNVLFAKCFRIHAQDKSAAEKQSIVPPEHAWVSSLAREQHSFRLAHFINKVKQHIKKNSTSINGPRVSLTSSISLIKNTFIANVELKSSRSALLQWYLQTGYVGKSPTPHAPSGSALHPPPPQGEQVGKDFFPIRICGFIKILHGPDPALSTFPGNPVLIQDARRPSFWVVGHHRI